MDRVFIIKRNGEQCHCGCIGPDDIVGYVTNEEYAKELMKVKHGKYRRFDDYEEIDLLEI